MANLHKSRSIDLKAFYAIIIFFILLVLLNIFSSVVTNSGDLGDYLGIAKAFNDDFSAKIRTSHGVIYGFLLSLPLKLINNLFVLRFFNLIWLVITAIFLYYITKSRKALYLFLFSPVVWFLGSTITPIIPSAFLFLLTYYFFNKYEEEGKIRYLIYSAISLGISSLLWDTLFMIYFIFVLVFFFNKKFKDFFIFSFVFWAIASIRFIVELYLFNFPFYSLLKFFGGNFLFSAGLSLNKWFFSLFDLTLFLISAFPLLIYCIVKYFSKEPKLHLREILFVCLFILMFFKNAQIRYILFLTPFLILLLYKELNNKLFLINAILSAILILFFVYPGLINNVDPVLNNDLNSIVYEYPNVPFLVVSNDPKNIDIHQTYANLYFGIENPELNLIGKKEYEMWKNNESYYWNFNLASNASKYLYVSQDYFINFGLKSTLNKLDYSKIKYLISDSASLNYEDFRLLKCYNLLCVYSRKN